MRSQIALGRIYGIRIGLHYSWFLIALLFLFTLAGGYHRTFPEWGTAEVAAWAVLTTVLFFISLLLHELSHSLLALRDGLQVREITLFALGGVSQIEGEVPSAKSELRIAIAGPLTSAAIGIVCLAATRIPAVMAVKAPAAMLFWLGYINLILAGFNLLPGFPMDGGRVLRAFLWSRSGDLDRATRTAAIVGNLLAITFIASGVIDYFRGGGLSALWIAFLGWFLLQASRDTQLQLSLRRELTGVRVADLMLTTVATVDGSMTVQDFVDQELLRTGRRCFIVRENGWPAGMVTPHDLQRVPQASWRLTPVHAVMRALENSKFVAPETPLLEALELMTREDLNQVPVVRAGTIEGMLSRAEIVAYLQTRAELGRVAGR